MANMSLVKNKMPEQDPNVRNKNFNEVALGYTAEQAVDEAQRCLHCKKKPCVQGCPVNIKIPEFIAKVAVSYTHLADADDGWPSESGRDASGQGAE